MQWYDINSEAPWLSRRDQYPEGNGLTGLFQGIASGYQVGQEAKERRKFNKGVDERSANAAAGSGGAGFGGVSGAARASLGMDKKIPGNFFTDMTRAYLGANMVPGSIEDVFNTQRIENQSLDIASKIEARNTSLRLKGAMLEFGQLFNEIGSLPDGWANPLAEKKRGEFLVRHPYFAQLPAFQKTQDWINDAKKVKDELLVEEGVSELQSFLSRQFGAGIGGEPATWSGVNKILSKHPKLALHPRTQALLGEVRTAQAEVQKDKRTEAGEDFKAQVEGMRQAAQTQRTQITAGQRHYTAIEVQQLRNLARTDPSGKAVSEARFIDRHLNEVMNRHGIKADEAVQVLQEVYRERGLGTPVDQQSGQPTVAKPSSSEKVRVKAPDGRTGRIPVGQLEDALKQGFERIAE